MQYIHSIIIALPLYAQITVFILSMLGFYIGAECVVEAARDIARRMKLPEVFIGLTIVSICSSLPEMFVAVKSGMDGNSDLIVASIIGSCFVQITFIFGLTVLLSKTIHTGLKEAHRDGNAVLLAIIALLFPLLDGYYSVYEALINILFYAIYVYYSNYAVHKNTIKHSYEAHQYSIIKAVSMLFLGICIIWLSTEFFVNIGVLFGREMGLSESVIGLFAGIGTSIPELVIGLIGIYSGATGISVGSLLGSNITDPLLSAGAGIIASKGAMMDSSLVSIMMPLWFIGTLITVSFLQYYGHITKRMGIFMMLFYVISISIFMLKTQ